MLYIFVIIKCTYWICYYNLLFGKNSIVYKEPHSIGFIKDVAFYLYNSTSTNLGYVFLLSAILLSILPFILIRHPERSRRTYFITDFILWILILNINNNLYPTLTGGDYLLNQFLFFNCFLAFEKNKNYFKIPLHNFASIAIVIQICLVYFLSALAKLNSAEWLDGLAISETLQVKHYSLNILLLTKQNTLNSIINYMVLFYQLLFPIIIWFKKVKKPFLIIGIVMHLFIAFGMGLMSFGFIMILAYIYFYDFKNDFRKK
ncbi:MAG: HTTM domain-containing protein [Bacteroidota bacterium]|nr:HTTM domain-containing protein [Bacteroidota bacterium]